MCFNYSATYNIFVRAWPTFGFKFKKIWKAFTPHIKTLRHETFTYPTVKAIFYCIAYHPYAVYSRAKHTLS